MFEGIAAWCIFIVIVYIINKISKAQQEEKTAKFKEKEQEKLREELRKEREIREKENMLKKERHIKIIKNHELGIYYEGAEPINWKYPLKYGMYIEFDENGNVKPTPKQVLLIDEIKEAKRYANNLILEEKFSEKIKLLRDNILFYQNCYKEAGSSEELNLINDKYLEALENEREFLERIGYKFSPEELLQYKNN